MNTELIAQARERANEDGGGHRYTYCPTLLLTELADALEAAQPKEPMVTPYISQAHFDRAFPDTAAQPAGEPVGVVDESDDGLFANFETEHGVIVKRGDKLYTHPAPQVPMTEAEIDLIWSSCEDAPTLSYRYIVTRALEAHHKIGVKL